MQAMHLSPETLAIESKLLTIQDRLTYLDHLHLLKEKQEFFLRNTIQHYNLNNLCRNKHGQCMYYDVQKEGCGIGRFIVNKEDCKKWDDSRETVCDIYDDLPQELKVCDKGFLSDMQGLHDTDRYWAEDGLNKQGEYHVSILCDYWKLAFENVLSLD